MIKFQIKKVCLSTDYLKFSHMSANRNKTIKQTLSLVGVKQQNISIMKRNLKKPKPKETEDDDHLRISDNNTTISNRKMVSTEGQRLGFGGVFDEMGYVSVSPKKLLPIGDLLLLPRFLRMLQPDFLSWILSR